MIYNVPGTGNYKLDSPSRIWETLYDHSVGPLMERLSFLMDQQPQTPVSQHSLSEIHTLSKYNKIK